MRKHILLRRLIVILCLWIISQAHAVSSSPLFVWNEQSFETKLYLSMEECQQQGHTYYFLLNGFQLNPDQLTMNPEISSISISGETYYFLTAHITDQLPFDPTDDCFLKGHPFHDAQRYSAEDDESGADEHQTIDKNTILCLLGRINKGFLFRDQYGIGLTTGEIVSDSHPPAIINMVSEEKAVEIAAEALQRKYPDFNQNALHCVVIFNADFNDLRSSYYIVTFCPGEDSRINYYSVYLNALDGTIEECYFNEQSFG